MNIEVRSNDGRIENAQPATPVVSAEVQSDEPGEYTPPQPYFTKTRTFLLIVFLPSMLAALYFAFWVSDQYMVESRMVVRTIGISEQFNDSEERSGRSIIGGDSLTQDAYIFANYVESAEMVRELEEAVGLRSLFSADSIDFLSRLSKDAPVEEVHSYWQSQIDTYVDGPSGIIVLRIRAFTPEDAVAISNAVTAAGREMIDKLSERAKADIVTRAEEEVRISLDAYTTSLDALNDYQNSVGLFDPRADATVASKLIAKLTESKLEAEVRLSLLEETGVANSPSANRLRTTISAIERQITDQQNSLASVAGDADSLASKTAGLARVETQRLMAQAIYRSARRNLDTAKSTALRRTTFVTVFSRPSMPEESRHPDRLSSWFVVTLLLFAAWAVATLTWMSVEDHRV
jgi:capsular polysaccharide transport system permease protein